MTGKLSYENYADIAKYAIDSGLIGKHAEVDDDAARVTMEIMKKVGYTELEGIPVLGHIEDIILIYTAAKKAVRKYRKLEKLERDRMLLVPY